jgi:hypothetical protein
MLQRAMELKKRKNLEPLKGYSFAALQYENLQQLAMDVNLKLGTNAIEANSLVDYLVKEEKQNYKKFIGENSEILLPVNLDEDTDLLNSRNNENYNQPDASSTENSFKGDNTLGVELTPVRSVKDHGTSPLWSEVVRKGKNRKKANGRSGKIIADDRCCLEY